MIVYHLDAQGGFTAGDTETRITCYAYPTSTHATDADRHPAHQATIAAEMVGNEHRHGFEHEADYDAHNWQRLHAGTAHLRGRVRYETDVALRPTYHDGTPRRTWDQLPAIYRWTWERPRGAIN